MSARQKHYRRPYRHSSCTTAWGAQVQEANSVPQPMPTCCMRRRLRGSPRSAVGGPICGRSPRQCQM
eukprot:3098631-Pyramimonas_sp.AAC.1